MNYEGKIFQTKIKKYLIEKDMQLPQVVGIKNFLRTRKKNGRVPCLATQGEISWNYLLLLEQLFLLLKYDNGFFKIDFDSKRDLF